MGCRWRGFGDGATTLGEARNIAAEHIHVCPRNGSLIKDAPEAKEEAQYRRQLEGPRQATKVVGIGQAANQHKKKLAQKRLRETMMTETNDTQDN